MVGMHPLERLGTPEGVANAAAFWPLRRLPESLA
jgi:hypothetical protein